MGNTQTNELYEENVMSLVSELSGLKKILNEYENPDKIIQEIISLIPQSATLTHSVFSSMLQMKSEDIDIVFDKFKKLHENQLTIKEKHDRVDEIKKLLDI